MMRQSTWALLVMGALSVAALGGCQSKPFCLNCVPGGNGDGGGGDGGNSPDLRGTDGGPGKGGLHPRQPHWRNFSHLGGG